MNLHRQINQLERNYIAAYCGVKPNTIMNTKETPAPQANVSDESVFLAECANTRAMWAAVANEFDPSTDTEADSSEHADMWAAQCLLRASPNLVLQACWALADKLNNKGNHLK